VIDYVGAKHDFHSNDFARGWADRFVPTSPRIQLFDLICQEIGKLTKKQPHIVELGIGPGYMARHILERNNLITYEGVDFSLAMFNIARKTVNAHKERIEFTKADLLDCNWVSSLTKKPDAIISTWALHDLGTQQAVADVYRGCSEILPASGILLNGDFIKPEGTTYDYEAGRFLISRHLELLDEAGFSKIQCLAHFEKNVVSPTAAQNYACFMGLR